MTSGVSVTPVTPLIANLQASEVGFYLFQNGTLRVQGAQHLQVNAGISVTPVTPEVSYVVSKYSAEFDSWFS